MNPVITGTANIGMLFSTINILLIPYLSNMYGSSALPARLLSIGMLISIFVGIFIGALSDRINRRMPFIVLLTSIAFFSLLGLGFISTSLSGFFAILLVVATYSVQPSQSAIVGDYSTKNHRDRNFGISAGLINISAFIISLVIGGLFSYSRGILFTSLGILVVLPIIPAFLYERKNRIKLAIPKDASKSLNSFTLFKKYPILLIFFAGLYGVWFALGGLYPYLTSFLSAETSLDLGTASVWMGGLNIIIGIVSFTTGFMVRKIGQERLLKLSLIILVTISGLIFFLYKSMLPGRETIVIWVAFFVLCGSAIGFVYSLSLSLLSSLVSLNDQGRAFGLNNIFIIVSQSTSVSLLGGILGKNSYKWIFAFVAIGFSISLISFSILFYLMRQKNKTRDLNLVEEKA